MRAPISKSLYALLVAGLTGCAKQPEADFSTDKDIATVGENITFTNHSDDAKSYLWSFGDGATSTSENATHAYTTPGKYTVTMKAFSKKEKKSDEKTSEIRVNDIEYEGAHYLINNGFVSYDDLHTFEIVLTNTNFLFGPTGVGNIIDVYVYSPSQSEFVPGTYTFSNDTVPFSLQGGDCMINFNMDTGVGTDLTISGGSIVISKSGTEYTFSFTFNVDNGKVVKGFFVGPVLMM